MFNYSFYYGSFGDKMTDYLVMKLALIDFEIDKLTSKKKHIDYRLDELYHEREDTFIEYNYQNKKVHDD